MFKKLVLALLLVPILYLQANADMQYTELQITKMDNPFMSGMPNMMGSMPDGNMPDMSKYSNMMPPNMQNMMQNIMSPPPVKTVYFIKGSKKRVDYINDAKSVISDCVLKKIIKVNHKSRTYEVLDMQRKIDNKENMCPSAAISDVPNTQDKITPGQLVFRTKITDTHEQQMIGSLMSHHYIQETEISGNPSCAPNMKNIEHLWVADFKAEEFNCPITEKFKYCPHLPPNIPQSNCFKNAKFIREGLSDVPGFVVKREFEMGMKGMPGMPDMAEDSDMDQQFKPSNFKVSNSTEITNISRNPIPDSVFLPPVGYKEVPANDNSYQSLDF